MLKISLHPVAKIPNKDGRLFASILHLENADLNVARVIQRVENKGHPVPPDKIRKRIPNTHNLMKQAIKLADNMLVMDNTDPDDRFKEMFVKQGKGIELFIENPPLWVQELIDS